MQTKFSVEIGKLKLNNPVLAASGTFGYAEEFKDFMDLRKLGAIVTKTLTLKPRQGNPAPRTCETPAGLLNSIGLENPGLEIFIQDKLPFLKKIGIPIIMSIASEEESLEFLELVSRINLIKEVVAVELNISCPNVQGRSNLISQDAESTYKIVQEVRKITDKVLITKLSPNVTSIGAIAEAAEKAGSDAVALINTLGGMSIDVEQRKPKVAAGIAGLSGPAIRPVAVRMVWEVFNKVKIPIIGMGGIMDVSSALEFIIAGATAVSIGTANFINPKISAEIVSGLKEYLTRNKIADIQDLTGSLKICSQR
ncbi:MAG: dihydroorotate dehydrogenase [Candidatus Omnitrophica bacterium]|nr:dihydroorotate dehydrogenase [Candidatus Omnitrophota bacterium]MDD5027673.1 dihydroorotate dehydrogenase [Candidatus Omnitrophota bacterium]MDD5661595.1 dihydroorotate dehydrogenase [Candidatus Omnitrophota bacterium]